MHGSAVQRVALIYGGDFGLETKRWALPGGPMVWLLLMAATVITMCLGDEI